MRIARISVYILLVFLACGLFVQAVDAAQIYYSVGQNTDDHKTGSPTITIASGTATFSVPQTAANMGVGDRVTYNTSSVAFISAKISATQWSLVTLTGGTPVNVVTGQTVNSIAHEFASLSDAIAGASDVNHLNTANLVAGTYVLNIPCYYDTASDSTSVTIIGYTTGPSNYIKIYAPNNTATEVNQSQRHNGTWSSTAYNLRQLAFGGDYVVISNSNVKLIGLQISGENTAGDANEIKISGGAFSGIEIGYCIIRGSGNTAFGTNIGIHIYSNSDGSTVKIYNNLIYNQKTDGIIGDFSDGSNIYVYNCTLIGPGGTSTGIDNTGSNTFVVKNTIVQGWSNGFSGTYDAASGYNISDLAADVPGSPSYNSTIVLFVNSASSNYHLSAFDTAARDAGADLSSDTNLSFSDDIDGQGRSGSWDIGADEYIVAPSSSSIPYSIGSGAQIRVLP